MKRNEKRNYAAKAAEVFMKKFIRLTAILLTVILAAGCFTVCFADDATHCTQNGIIYKLNVGYGTASVIGSTDDIAGDVTVPTTVTHLNKTYNLNRIESNAFDGRKNITVIRVQEGVAEIDANAFRGCTSLEDIYLPDTLTFCYANAFSGCNNTLKVHCYKRGSNMKSVELVTNAEFIYLDGDFNFGEILAGLWQLVLSFFNRVIDFFKGFI